MKPTPPATRTSAGVEKQLKGFIAKFEPRHQTLIRGVRKALRKRFPSACELVYDNYNFFVLGYGSTERPSDRIVSMAAAANGVGLCFMRGAWLPDPHKILHGSGKQTRFIRLESADVLARPEVVDPLAEPMAKPPGEVEDSPLLALRRGGRYFCQRPPNFAEANANFIPELSESTATARMRVVNDLAVQIAGMLEMPC